MVLVVDTAAGGIIEEFIIHNAEQYRREYPRLAQTLDRPNAAPAPGEVEFLEWVTDSAASNFDRMLVGTDIFFAAAIISILAPEIAIEIGTASGFSAAIFAKIISLREAASGRRSTRTLVHTVDKLLMCDHDRLKPIGFAIELMTPELRDRIQLHLERDSSYCREVSESGDMIGFVDANHRHPWPLCDVLQVLRLMRRGWILMHDIALPQAVECARAAGQLVTFEPSFGAKHVFDFWPDRKIRSVNIGAVRIPDCRDALKGFVSKLRTFPGEVSPGSWRHRWRTIDTLIASDSAPRTFSWTNWMRHRP